MLQHYALMLNYIAQTLPAALEFNLMFQRYDQLILFSSLMLIYSQQFCYQLPYGSTVCSTDTVQLLMPKEILLATTRSLLSTALNPLVLAGLVREPGYLARDISAQSCRPTILLNKSTTRDLS